MRASTPVLVPACSLTIPMTFSHIAFPWSAVLQGKTGTRRHSCPSGRHGMQLPGLEGAPDSNYYSRSMQEPHLVRTRFVDAFRTPLVGTVAGMVL